MLQVDAALDNITQATHLNAYTYMADAASDAGFGGQWDWNASVNGIIH
jgi:hypothetical protein